MSEGLETNCESVAAESKASIRVTLRQLKSFEDDERTQAGTDMRDLGITAVGPLLHVMRAESARRNGWRIALYATSVLAIVLSLLGIATGLSAGAKPFFVMLLIALAYLKNATRPSKMERWAARELARHQDAMVIGPLVEGLELEDHYTRGVVGDALKKLLPTLKSSDASQLSKAHLHMLYRALESEDLHLVIAILKALEQFGDEDAKSHVEKLIARPAVSDLEGRVRAAAEECIPALQAKVERDSVASTLLRATRSTEGVDDSLLRPASQSVVSSSGVLLRAVERAESES